MALVNGETHIYHDRHGRSTSITPVRKPDGVPFPCGRGQCSGAAYIQYVILNSLSEPAGSAYRCDTHAPTSHTSLLKDIRRQVVRQLGL